MLYGKQFLGTGNVAVCCSVLQCVAVCCSVLQCVAVCCSVLQCVAVWCGVLRVGTTEDSLYDVYKIVYMIVYMMYISYVQVLSLLIMLPFVLDNEIVYTNCIHTQYISRIQCTLASLWRMSCFIDVSQIGQCWSLVLNQLNAITQPTRTPENAVLSGVNMICSLFCFHVSA